MVTNIEMCGIICLPWWDYVKLFFDWGWEVFFLVGFLRAQMTLFDTSHLEYEKLQWTWPLSFKRLSLVVFTRGREILKHYCFVFLFSSFCNFSYEVCIIKGKLVAELPESFVFVIEYVSKDFSKLSHFRVPVSRSIASG